MNSLLPCPFCASIDGDLHWPPMVETRGYSAIAICTNPRCGAEIEITLLTPEDSLVEVIKRWNQRA